MLRCFVLVVALLAVQALARRIFYAQEDAERHFDQFIATFNKNYASEDERNFRFNIFKENLKKINEKNSMGHAVFGITLFTDLTVEEFWREHTGFQGDPEPDDVICKNVTAQGMDPAPDSLDWRDKGKVTKVKYQRMCGCGWAFSTTGNLEGQYAIKYDKLVEISEQQLIDCDEIDDGCMGGLPDQAMTWLALHNGSMTEKDYPYKSTDPRDCVFNSSKAILQVTDCSRYVNMTEDQLKQILADVGPLSIGVCANDLMNYKSGILECDPKNTEVNHGVLLVGYGQEGDKPYWIIKNSWSKKWGERGYVRLAMNKNSCMMLDYIVSAVVA